VITDTDAVINLLADLRDLQERLAGLAEAAQLEADNLAKAEAAGVYAEMRLTRHAKAECLRYAADKIRDILDRYERQMTA
jgi:hypothetical protein